jgi:hypothetical protein
MQFENFTADVPSELLFPLARLYLNLSTDARSHQVPSTLLELFNPTLDPLFTSRTGTLILSYRR